MGYYEFPHTRTYDQDLGELIEEVKGFDDKVIDVEDKFIVLKNHTDQAIANVDLRMQDTTRYVNETLGDYESRIDECERTVEEVVPTVRRVESITQALESDITDINNNITAINNELNTVESDVSNKLDKPAVEGTPGQFLGINDSDEVVWMNGGGGGSGTYNYNELNNKPSINGITLQGNTELSIPTKTSDLVNDSDYATVSEIPTSTNQLTNDSGFITASDIPTVPTKVSQLTNDSGYITASDIPTVPTKVSQLTNDSGYITSTAIAGIGTHLKSSSLDTSSVATTSVAVAHITLTKGTWLVWASIRMTSVPSNGQLNLNISTTSAASTVGTRYAIYTATGGNLTLGHTPLVMTVNANTNVYLNALSTAGTLSLNSASTYVEAIRII